MHDISLRYLVVFNEWPVASASDRSKAEDLLRQMKAKQLASLQETYPTRRFNTDSLWSIVDSETESRKKTGT